MSFNLRESIMTAPTRTTPSTIKLLAGAILATCATLAVAGPVGYLQIDGRISVQPDGAAAAIQISENAYTLFSNDRVDTSHGSAVLVLNGGGVIGLSKGSSATIQQSEADNSLSLVLDRGSVAYSMPVNAGNFTINVDNVQFKAVGAMQGTSGQELATGEAAGTLSVNENRQVSALARSGDIRVLRPSGLASTSAIPAGASVTSTSSVDQGLAAQSFDTLYSVSQGDAVQVQTTGTVSVTALAMANDAASMSSETAVGSEPAAGTAQAVEGNMAFVQSAQGSTLVVVGGEDDSDLQSVSP